MVLKRNLCGEVSTSVYTDISLFWTLFLSQIKINKINQLKHTL